MNAFCSKQEYIVNNSSVDERTDIDGQKRIAYFVYDLL